MNADGIENNASGTDNGAADQSNNTTPDLATLQAENRQLRARATQVEQDNAALRGEMDALQPYVRFGSDDNPAARRAQNAENPDEDLDPVVKLTNQVHSLGKELQATRGDLLADRFFSQNPDLRECEDLVTTMFSQTPGRNVEERLKRAGEKARQWIKDHDARVIAADRETKNQKAKSVAALDGVMDGAVTPAKSPEPEEVVDLGSYSNERRKESHGLHGGGA